MLPRGRGQPRPGLLLIHLAVSFSLSNLHLRDFTIDILIGGENDLKRGVVAGKKGACIDFDVFLLGSVYRKYPLAKNLRRINTASVELPRKDVVCSSQEVLNCPHVP